MKAYLEQKYNKVNSTTLDQPYQDNLYQGIFYINASTGNTHVKFRITENEAIKFITRVVKELGKIKKTEFNAYVNGHGGSNFPTGTYHPTYTKLGVIG